MEDEVDRIRVASRLAIAWLSNPRVAATPDSIAQFLLAAHEGFARLEECRKEESDGAAAAKYERAVSVRRSLASPARIISMIDGKPYASLRRHLAEHGLTPAEYRERYNLKPDYPLVAPALSEQRRATAKRIGLGRSHETSAVVEPAVETEAAVKPRRPKLSLSLKG